MKTNLSANQKKRIVLFASIEPEQHDALRLIAYRERRSVADLTREAIDNLIRQKLSQVPAGELKAAALEKVTAEATGVRR